MHNFLKVLEEEFGLHTALNFIKDTTKEKACIRNLDDLGKRSVPYHILLLWAFNWAGTSQGHSFWDGVYTFLENLPQTREVCVEEAKELLDFYSRNPNMKLLI